MTPHELGQQLGRFYHAGLGTKIATIAQPVARGVDAVFNTDLANCSGCKGMQKDLDKGTKFLDALVKRMKGQYK